jgi:hypothetical protein
MLYTYRVSGADLEYDDLNSCQRNRPVNTFEPKRWQR